MIDDGCNSTRGSSARRTKKGSSCKPQSSKHSIQKQYKIPFKDLINSAGACSDQEF